MKDIDSESILPTVAPHSSKPWVRKQGQSSGSSNPRTRKQAQCSSIIILLILSIIGLLILQQHLQEVREASGMREIVRKMEKVLGVVINNRIAEVEFDNNEGYNDAEYGGSMITEQNSDYYYDEAYTMDQNGEHQIIEVTNDGSGNEEDVNFDNELMYDRDLVTERTISRSIERISPMTESEFLSDADDGNLQLEA